MSRLSRVSLVCIKVAVVHHQYRWHATAGRLGEAFIRALVRRGVRTGDGTRSFLYLCPRRRVCIWRKRRPPIKDKGHTKVSLNCYEAADFRRQDVPEEGALCCLSSETACESLHHSWIRARSVLSMPQKVVTWRIKELSCRLLQAGRLGRERRRSQRPMHGPPRNSTSVMVSRRRISRHAFSVAWAMCTIVKKGFVIEMTVCGVQ